MRKKRINRQWGLIAYHPIFIISLDIRLWIQSHSLLWSQGFQIVYWSLGTIPPSRSHNWGSERSSEGLHIGSGIQPFHVGLHCVLDLDWGLMFLEFFLVRDCIIVQLEGLTRRLIANLISIGDFWKSGWDYILSSLGHQCWSKSHAIIFKAFQ